jgi:NADPH-dependent 2,4-dienoyl-CoA reductase/sulfur reductase-like enzyme/nitrite reductase/ring-hydroxylating ferredoxin subunit
VAEQTPETPRPRDDGLWDVAAIASIADGAMLGVEAGETKLLLLRSGGTVSAVSGSCPHAGAPLAEGLRCGERIICPWHKASFDLRSGALVEPPAVDPLPAFPVRIENGRVLVSLEPSPAAATATAIATARDDRCFVIIGAGAAGQSAAQTLREDGFQGRLVLVSREPELPYDRTVLSKYKLSGQPGAEKTPLQDAAFYERHRITRMTATVAEVDAPAAMIRFADGTALAYDAALLATGGTPHAPNFPGADLEGVFLLRTPGDADAILARAEDGRRAVIIGGGFIAMEAAASLRERGMDVTVVMPEATPFEKQVGPMIGAVFARLHAQKGVVLRTRQTVAGLDGDETGSIAAVRLANGERLPAGLVVVGSGIRPATDILRGVALRPDGGVPVDRFLRAAPKLFAAGDVAAFPLQGEGSLTRVEHWRVAQQQGRTAARNMLERDMPFDAVPYFWTIHFLKRLDYVGHAEEWDTVIVDGDLQKPEFIALYVKAGRVDAVIGWDRDQDIARTICLFEHRREWQADAFLAALAEGRSGQTG